MSPRFSSLMLLVMATTLAAGQATSSVRKTAAFTQAHALATSITTITATPSPITFSATDPDAGPYSGSSASTVKFNLTGGGAARSWTLSVTAGAATFTGCTTIPASAVKATCATASVVNVSGSAGTAACSAGANLSTSALTIATGNEGKVNDFTITINFVLTDSWSYIAQTSPLCPLTLTYSLNAP
jgi:hypothetical protein